MRSGTALARGPKPNRPRIAGLHDTFELLGRFRISGMMVALMELIDLSIGSFARYKTVLTLMTNPQLLTTKTAGSKTVGRRRISGSLSTEICAKQQANALLDQHPHFRGRRRWIQCDCKNRILYLDGRLPTFHLKQLAQEAVRNVQEIDQIVNRIVVASPVGEVTPRYSPKPR